MIRFGEVLQHVHRRSYDQRFRLAGQINGRLDLSVFGSRDDRKTQVDIGPATADYCAARVRWDLRRNTAAFVVRPNCLHVSFGRSTT